MTEPAAITAARELLRAYYNCQPLPRLAEQLAGETPIDTELLAETQRCLREAIAENEQLRAALAEREVEQEPDAWLYETPMPDGSVFVGASTERLEIGVGVPTGSTERPLYTAPPRREWRGLTVKERASIYDKYRRGEMVDSFEMMFAVEDKLKGKNHD